MALLGAGAARGGALQIERRDQVVEHRLLDRRCQVQRLHPVLTIMKKKASVATRLWVSRFALARCAHRTLGEVRLLGDRLQARKQRP